ASCGGKEVSPPAVTRVGSAGTGGASGSTTSGSTTGGGQGGSSSSSSSGSTTTGSGGGAAGGATTGTGGGPNYCVGILPWDPPAAYYYVSCRPRDLPIPFAFAATAAPTVILDVGPRLFMTLTPLAQGATSMSDSVG